jgi:hypothetical protein
MEKRTVHQAVFDSKIALQIAKLAHKHACEELEKTPRHMLDEGNPNHPMYDTIFGYDREEFMAKQYK